MEAQAATQVDYDQLGLYANGPILAAERKNRSRQSMAASTLAAAIGGRGHSRRHARFGRSARLDHVRPRIARSGTSAAQHLFYDKAQRTCADDATVRFARAAS